MLYLTTRIEMLELLITAFSRPREVLAREIAEGSFSTRIVNRIASCCEGSSRCCFPKDLIETIRKLPDEFKEVQEDRKVLTILDAEYLRLFVNDFPSAWVQPYESWYHEGRTMGKAALECLELYQRDGLAPVGGGELPDHLVTQLEYLLFLTLLEKKASSEEDVALYRMTRVKEQHFYERHIMTWLPTCCARVQTYSRVSFYRVMARFLRNFIVLGNRNLHLHRSGFDEGVAHDYKTA